MHVYVVLLISTCFAQDVTFTRTANDIVPRMFHRASLLHDGRVIVTGGTGVQFTPRAELKTLNAVSFYDPGAHTFSPGPSLITPRSEHTQSMLPDGRVLITGGLTGASGHHPGHPVDSAEIIDPASGDVSPLPAMCEPRSGHSATLLPDGRVVIVGGTSWQMFDPTTDEWGSAIALERPRHHHAAVRIDRADDPPRILLIGGKGGGATLEIIDVAGGSSRVLDAQLEEAVDDLAAVRMSDNSIIIVGGQRLLDGDTINHAYRFDPAPQRLARIADVPLERGIADHQLISIGTCVLAIGGEQQHQGQDRELDVCLLYDTTTSQWTQSSMLHAHDDACAILLPDGRVAIIGGGVPFMGRTAPSATVELLQFVAPDTSRHENDG